MNKKKVYYLKCTFEEITLYFDNFNLVYIGLLEQEPKKGYNNKPNSINAFPP